MRVGILLTLIGTWIMLTVTTQPLPAQVRVARSASIVVPDRTPPLKIEGPPRLTLQEAWQAVETDAVVSLVKHFQDQGMTLTHPPTMAELRPVLAGLPQWKYTVEQKVFDNPVGQLMYWIVLEVPVTPEVKNFLAQKERERRVQERMFWLGRVLAGLIVLLAAAALYFRLDDWTKGYYTTWLRLAALGFITTGVLALLLIA
jgi:hypothetical protein